MPKLTPLEEQNAFYDAIGKSVHHWTAVEHALGVVFCGCIGRTDTHSDDGILLAAFYAVANFRSKLGMVDATVKASGDKHDLRQNWEGLFDKTKNASEVRNKFMHYTVASPVNYRPGAIVIVPNINNPYLHTRIGKQQEQYTYKDISKFNTIWEELASSLRLFGTDIRRLRAQQQVSS